MFILTEIQERLSIIPSQFDLSLQDAIQLQIHDQYANKYLPDVGFCVSVYDILSSTAPKIIPGKGEYHVEVNFRLIVFRPSLNEILIGKVIAADKFGLRIAIGAFFTKVKLPPHLLQENTEWNEVEKVWAWRYEDHDLYLDIGSLIRFRVQSVNFDESGKMKVHGKINEDGLGMITWW